MDELYTLDVEELIELFIQSTDRKVYSLLMEHLNRTHRTNSWMESAEYGPYTVQFLDEDFNPLPSFIVHYTINDKPHKVKL